MEVRKIENTNDYLQNLKLRGCKMFSQDELDFFVESCRCSIYEFTQELQTETDADFYHHFAAWLKESEINGYVYYYLIAGMRKNENLSGEEYEYLEKNITSCFDLGYGWITQTNHELRFKRRMKLILFEKKDSFHRLIWKTRKQDRA